MLKNIKNQTHGFTLIEVILSIAILSIVSVVVLRLFLVSHELNESSRMTDLASNTSINVIETIKGYQSVDTYIASNQWIKGSNDYYEGSILYDETLTPNENASYKLECQLTQDKTFPTLYDITVSITDLNSLDILVTYRASHYFSEGGVLQ